MELIAKVVKALPLESGVSAAGKEWKKGTIIVEYGDRYPKQVALCTLQQADSFTSLPIGSNVKFYVDVTSREFNGKWYTTVECWKWELVGAAAPVPPPPAPAPVQEKESDMPF